MARWADVEREYQRRENLIPNLVYAVSKYASYEQGVFKYVSDAREALKTIRSSETSGTQVSSLLEKTLSRLVALAEEYPDLKATQSIQDLIAEAANTENRIADAKKEYNHECEIYNQYQSVFPGNVFAFIYRFKPLPYIGLEEQVDVPVIDLDVTQGRAAIKGDVEVPANDLNKTEGVKE
jgi:LemA protein